MTLRPSAIAALLGLALLLPAGVAHAQGDDPRRMRREGTGMSPIAVGGLMQERAPLLRSWIHGWGLTGSNPAAYEIRCDELYTSCGMPIFRTRASSSEPYGMGSVTHSESALGWRGQRVRLSATLRTGRVDGWAGLWMRIDGADGKPLAFDNMQNRPLRGTSTFQEVEVVLEVPQEAERISFGVLLHGPGAVWLREIQFEEAPPAAVSTDMLEPLRSKGQESKTVETAPKTQATDVAKH